jgi:hypothetical protein
MKKLLITGAWLLVWMASGGSAQERDSSFVFSWQVMTSGQYVGAALTGDSMHRSTPLTLRYDEVAPLAGLKLHLALAGRIEVTEDIRLTKQEEIFFDQSAIHNVITDLHTVNSHIVRQAAVRYRTSSFTFMAGRLPFRFGPGVRGTLVLSDNVPGYDALGFNYQYRDWRFHYLTAKINPARSPCWFTYHRLELPEMKNFSIGLAEANVTFADQADLLSANPVMFFHNIDRKTTNYLGGGDVVYTWRGSNVYVEVGIDDILARSVERTTPAPTNLGYQIGIRSDSIGGLSAVSVVVEFTHIDRLMYERYQRHTRADSLHFKVCRDYPEIENRLGDPQVIGYWTGTNSQDLFARLEYKGWEKLPLALSYEYIRKGDPAAGRTLAGVVDTRSIASLACACRYIPHATITLRYALYQAVNYQHHRNDDFTSHEVELKATVSLGRGKMP